jgi:gamma-glutamylcyclotransferase (GGCT)/AIG2-like uncharacterized protein YtfP
MPKSELQQSPRWWRDQRVTVGLQVALDHINEAREDAEIGRPGWVLEACESMFKALNQLANSLEPFLPPSEAGRPRSETSKHRALLTQLTTDARTRLVAHAAVKELALFEPDILSHSARGMSQAPLTELPADVIQAASGDHREFRKAWQRWNESGSRSRDVYEALVRCVLVVRNNAFHGEKTRSGPDRERTRRNRDVAALVLPVLIELLDEILDRPSTRLIAYGTLRPGQQNHGVITVTGTWRPVTVQGVLTEQRGLPAFALDLGGQVVEADLFESERIGEIWPALDAFEGRQYARRLCVCNGDGMAVAVANVYQVAECAWED